MPKFQFPSNGKAYLNTMSIIGIGCGESFQFPSNGKAYLNLFCGVRRCHQYGGFQFPSNGKAYLNVKVVRNHSTFVGLSFNSLQTGKRIWTFYAEWYLKGSQIRFQFPSNGKAYLNWGRQTSRPDSGKRVSIPFKRESVSEPGDIPSQGHWHVSGFNSLQTGKRIWTEKEMLDLRLRQGFNSLQTGKRIWTCLGYRKRYCPGFQFPSNGKAYLNWKKYRQPQVSKRRFQFPSNGKAYLNWGGTIALAITHLRVSIPFKRESVSEQR